MKERKSGAHEWLIEFKNNPECKVTFAEYLDTALQDLNSDYEAKRYKSMTLAFPKVHVSRKNVFYDWLKSKEKLGGQHKIPRWSNNRKLLEELMDLNAH